jgi:uncharacterized surface protein with fasciclin (FAS1) repeats
MKLHKGGRLLAIMGVLAVAIGLVAGTTGAGAKKSAKKQTIAEIAGGSSQFDTLTSLLGTAGLAETLDGKGKFTVFAPTDAAFAKVPKSTLDALAADTEQLKAVLLYHVASGRLTAKKVVRRSSIKTLNGASVKVRVTKKGVRVNDAKVVKTDIKASNGVVHVINKVLLPPS